MERHRLERETAEVRVGERRFRLIEMSGAALRRYIDHQVDALEAAAEDLDEGDPVEELVHRAAVVDDDLFIWLLGNPLDGGPPADHALVGGLTPAMREQLLGLQDGLNDIEEEQGRGSAAGRDPDLVWAELIDLVAARYSLDPFRVWGDPDLPGSGWPIRHILLCWNLAARARWRERADAIALAGGKPGEEPEWNFGGGGGRMDDHQRQQYEAWLARKQGSKT